MPLHAGPPGRGAWSAQGWSAQGHGVLFSLAKNMFFSCHIAVIFFGKTLKTCSLSKLVNMHVYHLHHTVVLPCLIAFTL